MSTDYTIKGNPIRKRLEKALTGAGFRVTDECGEKL